MKNILCYIFLLVFSFNTYGFELSSDTPFIMEAADQIDYLFNRNDEIEKTGSEETKWYIYFLGKNTETLKYIIEDSSYKTFSDNYLNQLNNLLTEINTSYGVVMYVGLTDYTKPIVLPFFPEGGTVLEKIEALRSRLDEVQNIQEASGSDINIGIEYLKKYKNTFGEIVDRIYEESVLPELGGKDYILPVSVYHNITVNEFSKNYHSIVVKRSAALKEKDTEFQVLRKSNTPPFGSTNDERMIANITDSYQKILSGNYELPIADVPIKKPFELTLCDYLPENNKVDEYGVTEAIKKLNTAYQRRNAINDTQTPRNKGDFYHLINVAGGDLSGKAEVIEDKLYLLKQKTGINFYVVFQPVATKMNIGAREEFAKQVLEGSALNGSSNTILITVPFLEILPTGNFTPLSCIQPGFVQSSSSLITSQGFKEASDLFNYVFEAYKEIEKPVYLVRYFESVSGELVRLEYSSSSNLKGLPYINAVRYYRSKYASEKAELEKTLSLLLSKEDVEHNSSLVIDYQNQIKQKVEEGVLAENQIGYDVQNNIWQQEEAIVSQNVGFFREPYITNQDLVNQFIDKSSNDWVYGVKFDVVFNNGKLSKEHFYNIDNFSIVDPAVYGLIDVAGLIPGIDIFADPIGMLYAGYRDNSENILAYSLASAITGAGAMYFKAGGEVFGVVAKLDDTGNLSYVVRSINEEVTENELQLTSSYLRQKDIAEGALVEIQKQQNDEHIKSLILAKKGLSEGGSIISSLNKLVGKESSENIIWKNLDDSNIIWANPNNNILSTAKSFAEETGNSLYDAVFHNGYYVKFDLDDGRILLGNTDGFFHAFAVLNDIELGAFKSSIFNVSDEVFSKELKQLLSTNSDKLKILSGAVSRSIVIAGKKVVLNPNKVNTILGRYDPDIQNLFEELGSFKSVGLGETIGGLNLLNKPKHYPYTDPQQWWSEYNYNWLKMAVGRGDNIYLATKDFSKFTNNGKITTYAYEIRYLIQKNYKPKNLTNREWTEIHSIINQIFK